MSSPSSGHDAGIQPAEIISRCRILVQPMLRSFVDGLHPRLMVRYSFGWCSAEGAAESSDSQGAGKGVRQSLTVLAAEAVGGAGRDAVPAAVATELVHALSLIHDDIMDDDEWRRHRPTVWKTYGVGPALLPGDVLLALAMETVARAAGERSPQALHLLCGCLRAVMHGQAEDMVFEARPSRGPGAVTAAEHRVMADNKTGALLGCSAALGVLSAAGTPQQIKAFGTAGREMGLAFQIMDDFLGIWGDSARAGKPVGSDLRQRKKTLPVLKVLEQGGTAAHRLADLFSGSCALDDSAVEEAVRADRRGGRSGARARRGTRCPEASTGSAGASGAVSARLRGTGRAVGPLGRARSLRKAVIPEATEQSGFRTEKGGSGMTEIERIEIDLSTGDEPGAGTDALVYLGLGGREFLLDNYDEDDFRRGEGNLFRLGVRSTVAHPSTNDPRMPPLTFGDLDRHPVYLRLNAQVENDSWLLANAWVVVRSDGQEARYGRSALDSPGGDRSIWLGIRDGCVLHLECAA